MPVDAPASARRRENLGSVAARRLSGWLSGYRPYVGVPDELMTVGGPRDYWLCFLGDFVEYDESDFETRFNLATRHIRDTGVSYRIYGEENERSWPINPLPLILSEGE